VRIIGSKTHQYAELDPKTLVINKGTCVVWFNRAAGSNVKIIFEEGKKVCEDVVEASMDFKLDENNCFVTATYIPPFGTASLAFSKAGAHDYVVEVKGTATKIKGRINVKAE
jgi:hypothetical protein